MNRKKIIILIVTVVFAVSICGAHFMYGNYQRGAELAEYASQVLVPCTSFADNIEYNIRMFLNPEVYNPEFYPGYIDKYFFDYTLGAFLHIQRQQLHLRLAKRNMGNTLPQSFLLTIVKSTHFWGHTLLKYVIDRFQDTAAGAEIAG